MKYQSLEKIPMFENFIKENSMATVSSVNGMGAPTFPGSPGTQSNFVDQKTGSGDIPHSLPKRKSKKKKNSIFVSYREFIKDRTE